jgi:uncharacterized protein YbjT (DUF2867 family)
MKIFIAGATGFVGGHLTEELLLQGHQLVLLSHNRKAVDRIGVSFVQGDISEPDSFLAAVKGCDAVINLVGIIREFPAKNITFERLHVEATANMISVAQRAGVLRYLQISALGARLDAVSAYHQTKWRAEELVRGSGLAWTIFRPSIIFGVGDAFVNMLAGQLKLAPVMPVIGSGQYRLQPLHADDLARCFARSLEMPETAGHSYDLCGPDRFSYCELLDCIANAMGKKPPLKLKMPLWLMQPLIEALQRFTLFPITKDQLQMLLEESICNGTWQETFSFEPIRFADGIRSYLAPKKH